MAVKEIIGLLTGIVVLAGFSVAIINGGQTASVLQAGADGFKGLIEAATHPGH